MSAPDGAPDGDPGRRRWSAVLVLLLAAAIFPEVLSGSTPVPLLVVSPLGFLELVGLYGCGAILVWEAIARWKKGWLSVLPFGAAYGIAEEGLGTKVMTDPHQQLLITGLAGPYGHWGVQWVTLSAFTMFHAVFSIGYQILLVALLFPELKGRSIVTCRGLAIDGAVFAAVVTLMFFTDDKNPIAPLWPGLAFVSLLAVAFIVIGRYLPDGFLSSWMKSPTPASPPRTFFVVGFLWVVAFFAVWVLGTHLIPYAAVPALLFPVIGLSVLYVLVTRMGWRENRRHQVAYAGGFAAAFFVWDVLLELSGDVGVLAFSALLVAIVVWLWYRPEGPPVAPAPTTGLAPA
jgi:hypothetical protein